MRMLCCIKKKTKKTTILFWDQGRFFWTFAPQTNSSSITMVVRNGRRVSHNNPSTALADKLIICISERRHELLKQQSYRQDMTMYRSINPHLLISLYVRRLKNNTYSKNHIKRYIKDRNKTSQHCSVLWAILYNWVWDSDSACMRGKLAPESCKVSA